MSKNNKKEKNTKIKKNIGKFIPDKYKDSIIFQPIQNSKGKILTPTKPISFYLKKLFILVFIIFVLYGITLILDSGIIEIGDYKYLPKENANMDQYSEGSTSNPIYVKVIDEFVDDLKSRSALDSDSIINASMLYARYDSVMKKESKLGVELHSQYNSVEKTEYFFIKIKNTSNGWTYINGDYAIDSQKTIAYKPYKGVQVESIKKSLLNKSIKVANKDLTITENNILELSILNQNTSIESKKDNVVVNISLRDDILQYTGDLTLDYIFEGSNWNLTNIDDTSKFNTKYVADDAPNFSNDDYIKFISSTPYVLNGGELEINFSPTNIQNIQVLNTSISDNGTRYNEEISFDALTYNSIVTINANLLYTYNSKDESNKWDLKQVDYSHEFSNDVMSGVWSGETTMVLKSKDISDFSKLSDEELQEFIEKEKSGEEKNSSKYKATILMSYTIQSTGELDEYEGVACWAEMQVDEDGKKTPIDTQTNEFIASFDRKESKLVFRFINEFVFDREYKTLTVNYDFVDDCLVYGNSRFYRIVDDTTQEKDSIEDNANEDKSEEGDNEDIGDNNSDNAETTTKEKKLDEAKSSLSEEKNKSKEKEQNEINDQNEEKEEILSDKELEEARKKRNLKNK